MNWIRSGTPVYVHLSVADVHVSSVAGRLDHAKLGTGVGRGKSELATVGGWDVKLTVARMDPGSERDMVLVLKTVRDKKVAIDDSIREYGRGIVAKGRLYVDAAADGAGLEKVAHRCGQHQGTSDGDDREQRRWLPVGPYPTTPERYSGALHMGQKPY